MVAELAVSPAQTKIAAVSTTTTTNARTTTTSTAAAAARSPQLYTTTSYPETGKYCT